MADLQNDYKVIGVPGSVGIAGDFDLSSRCFGGSNVFGKQGVMSAMIDKRSCTLHEQVHPHGSETCFQDVCMACNDGRWEKEMDIYPPERHMSGAETEKEK